MQTILSIYKNYKNFKKLKVEINISDNCSDKKDYDSLVRYLNQLLINEKNISLNYFRFDKQVSAEENWQKSIEMCNGEYFILLSDDDLISEINLNDIDIFFKNHDIIFFDSVSIDANSNKILKRNAFLFDCIINSKMSAFLLSISLLRPTLCSIAFKTDIFKKNSLKITKFGLSGDHSDGFLILDYLSNSKNTVKICKIVFSKYRIHKGSNSFNLNIKKIFKVKKNFIMAIIKSRNKFSIKLFGIIWALCGLLPQLVKIIFFKFWFRLSGDA